jgi:uncharacterized membrane protein YkoI
MNLRLVLPIIIAIASLTPSAHAESKKSEATLEAEARITEDAARKIALATTPKGKIKESELEKEHGKLVWSFDIALPGAKDITEVQVDAKTGEVVSKEVETAADQAKEAAEDKSADKD